MLNFLLRLLRLEDSAPIEYQLNLDATTLRHSLESAANKERGWFVSKGFLLRFSTPESFTLTHISNRNTFRRYLWATLKERDGKTTITGRFRVHRFIAPFMFFWTTCMLLIVTILLAALPLEKSLPMSLIPLLAVLFPHLGRLLSLQDEKAVIRLLDETFSGYIAHKHGEQ